ncbi:MAG: hypothetical protein V1720_18715 [bacterium]
MKNVLIVHSEMSSLLAQAMQFVLTSEDSNAIVCSHIHAMGKFIEEEPQVVVILDYHEGINEGQLLGERTFKDLKASATDEKIIRCGLDDYGYEDYLKLPCNIKHLRKLLGF